MRHRAVALKLAERRARRAAKRRHWDRVLAAGCAELRRATRQMDTDEAPYVFDFDGFGVAFCDSGDAFGWCAGGGLAS